MAEQKALPRVSGERVQYMAGHTFPYIQIRDHQIARDEIVLFELICDSFLPRLKIHLQTGSLSMIRENRPVDGDRVSIFIRQDLKVFRPIKGDYIIKTVIIDDGNETEAGGTRLHEIYIEAILDVPNFISEYTNFHYYGKAEDALRDAAKRANLGFTHTENIDTKYNQAWYCNQKLDVYIQHITRHMWRGSDSFFDSWVDPYWNLTVVNVSDILGRKLADDKGATFTKLQHIVSTYGQDGPYISNDHDTKEESKVPKILTNMSSFESTSFYVKKWLITNNSSTVSRDVGIQENLHQYIDNYGLGDAEKDSRGMVEAGVWYNQEKKAAGYMTFNGPREVYRGARKGNYKDQLTQVKNNVVQIESDEDNSKNLSMNDNSMASGNVYKMYKVAEYHNYINLRELDKQYMTVWMRGMNLSIIRGDKIPVLLYEQDDSAFMNSNRQLDFSHVLDRQACGWFYIKELTYRYRSEGGAASDWQTICVLSRKEWFPPEPTTDAYEAGDDSVLNNVAKSKNVLSSTDEVGSGGGSPSGGSNANVPADTSAGQEDRKDPDDDEWKKWNEFWSMVRGTGTAAATADAARQGSEAAEQLASGTADLTGKISRA